MKKVFLLFAFVAITAWAHAQIPQAKQKAKTPAKKTDTIRKRDNMPVLKPNDNSPMPVLVPAGNSKMPVLNPDAKKVERNIQPKRKP